MVRRNQPGSGEFAAMWAELPRSRQQAMIRELRTALREVRNAGSVNTVHEPMAGTHSHAHHAYKSQGDDASHSHEHTHDGDANHDHVHAEAAADRAGGRYRKHVRFQGGEAIVMSAGRKARLDAAWERAARDARDIQKGQT